MQLYQFIGYFASAAVLTYGAMHVIEWFVRSKGVLAKSVISTGVICAALSVMGWLTHFHLFILYSYCACLAILWSRYWYYYNEEEPV